MPTTRSLGRYAVAIAAVALAACSTARDQASAPADAPATEEDVLDAAHSLCPIVWDYVKGVGEVFNDAASDVASIPTGDERRARWLGALADVEALALELGPATEPWSEHPALSPLIAEIERDIPRALSEVEDIRDLFAQRPELDDERHQVRTQQVIVRIEKVIDLPKPDLTPNDPDGMLREVFRTVPSCQHAIRGADDGTPRANG